MLRALWLFFICLLLSSIIVTINFTIGSNFLLFFIKEQLVMWLLTIIGFNAASIVFLVSQIASIEIEKKISFSRAKKEIFHNFIWMLSIFLLVFLLVVAYKNFSNENMIFTYYDYTFFILIMSWFLFLLYLFYEILNWIIHLSKND